MSIVLCFLCWNELYCVSIVFLYLPRFSYKAVHVVPILRPSTVVDSILGYFCSRELKLIASTYKCIDIIL